MAKALEILAKLIDGLPDGVLNNVQIKAWNKLLKRHIGLWGKDYYIYDKQTKEIKRVKLRRQ